MNAAFRLAKVADADALFDIRRRSIAELARGGMPVAEADMWAASLTVDEMSDRIRDFEIWIAEVGRAPVGWGSIRGHRLEGLYILPEFAGRHIGTMLLDLLEGIIRKRGFPAVEAEASANAEAFYLRRGYERHRPRTKEGAQPIRKQLA
jgi:putative acetyltransferase